MRAVLDYVGIAELQVILGLPTGKLAREHVYRLIKNDPAFPEALVFPESGKKVWDAGEAIQYAHHRNRLRGWRSS